MKTQIVILALFFSTQAYAGGAGGSWGEPTQPTNDYSGGGGGFGGGGAGGSWETCKYTTKVYGKKFEGNSANEVCQSIPHELIVKPSHYLSNNYKSFSHRKLRFSSSYKNMAFCDFKYNHIFGLQTHTSAIIKTDCDTPKICKDGQTLDPTTNQCKKDPPEDCDPIIQECDENGKPLCDCCTKLDTLIGINQKIQSNTAQTNNILNQTNNHLTDIKSNTAQTNTLLNQTNTKLDTLINILQNKGIEVDLSKIESQLDQLIAKEVDLTAVNQKLDELIQAIKDNKYDDTQLLKRLDDALSLQVQNNEKLDEQTGLLVQIRDLLKPAPQTLQSDLSLSDEPINVQIDPWQAIRGFDIHQNRINAQKQCPSSEHYSFDVFGTHFVMPLPIFCDALARLAPAFLFLAYMAGAFIIVKGTD